MIELVTAVAEATKAVAVALDKPDVVKSSAAVRRAAGRLVWALLAMDDRPERARQLLAKVVSERDAELRRMGEDPAAIVRSAADALEGVGHEDVARLRVWADAR